LFSDEIVIDDLPCEHLREIYQYWLKIKGPRHMPARADIKPKEIVSLLPHLSMIDVEHDPVRFRFRLVGTETVRAMGMDVTGMYTDMNPATEKLNKRYKWMLKNKQPYLYKSKLSWTERDFLDYYALAMPLSDNGEDINIILYGMHYTFPGLGERTTEIILK